MSLAIKRGKILIMWERSLYDEFFETAVRFCRTLCLCFEYPRSLKVYYSQDPMRLPELTHKNLTLNRRIMRLKTAEPLC